MYKAEIRISKMYVMLIKQFVNLEKVNLHVNLCNFIEVILNIFLN